MAEGQSPIHAAACPSPTALHPLPLGGDRNGVRVLPLDHECLVSQMRTSPVSRPPRMHDGPAARLESGRRDSNPRPSPRQGDRRGRPAGESSRDLDIHTSQVPSFCTVLTLRLAKYGLNLLRHPPSTPHSPAAPAPSCRPTPRRCPVLERKLHIPEPVRVQAVNATPA